MTIVDISHYQAISSWPQLAAAASAVWHKATQGGGYVDAFYRSRAVEAAARHVPWGGYHFAEPDGTPGDAEREADHFVAVLRSAPFSLRPMLDLEGSAIAASLTDDWALRFCARVDAALALPAGRGTILYTGPGWAATHLEPNPLLARRDLWVAHYTGAPAPHLPRPWTSYLLWQYSSSGHIAGVDGTVDVDRLGSGRTLADLLVAAQPAPPTPPPEDDDMGPCNELWSAVQAVQAVAADSPQGSLGDDGIAFWADQVVCSPHPSKELVRLAAELKDKPGG